MKTMTRTTPRKLVGTNGDGEDLLDTANADNYIYMQRCWESQSYRITTLEAVHAVQALQTTIMYSCLGRGHAKQD